MNDHAELLAIGETTDNAKVVRDLQLERREAQQEQGRGGWWQRPQYEGPCAGAWIVDATEPQ